MSGLFRIGRSFEHDPRIETWFVGDVRMDREADTLLPEPQDLVRRLAQAWFDRLRACGPDVREIFHDDCPVACVEDAPFAYVNAYKAYAAVGFFHGAALPDPSGLLEGAGKRMRHVKLRPGEPVNEAALEVLIAAAYRHIRERVAAD